MDPQIERLRKRNEYLEKAFKEVFDTVYDESIGPIAANRVLRDIERKVNNGHVPAEASKQGTTYDAAREINEVCNKLLTMLAHRSDLYNMVKQIDGLAFKIFTNKNFRIGD